MQGVVAIFLAAGQGTRLGGPKALLLAHGVPLVEAQCRERLAAESARALAVVRPDVAALVGDRLRAAGAEVVVSRAPDALGPAGSLAAAAAHLAGDPSVRVALVSPVDVRAAPSTAAALVGALLSPATAAASTSTSVSASTTEAAAPVLAASASVSASTTGAAAPVLAAASASVSASTTEAAAPVLAAVPRYAGRRGHPVALHALALARYLEPDPPPLRDHLRALGERVAVVDVDDPLVLEDLDFAHQTSALLRMTGASEPRFWGRAGAG